MKKDLGLSFPVLVDAEGATARAYGIWNERNGKVPHPTALVIDREGIVRFVRVDEDYKVRPDPSELIEAVKALR